MISERELNEAIRDYEQQPMNAQRVAKLVDLYALREHLYSGSPASASVRTQTEEKKTMTEGGTEFLQMANGKDINKILIIIDNLMQTIKVLHPRMYDRVLDLISDL